MKHQIYDVPLSTQELNVLIRTIASANDCEARERMSEGVGDPDRPAPDDQDGQVREWLVTRFANLVRTE